MVDKPFLPVKLFYILTKSLSAYDKSNVGGDFVLQKDIRIE